MNRHEFHGQLVGLDLSQRLEERDARERMLELLASGRDCFSRSCFPAHFTGSSLVVSSDGRQVLLHHHRKLDRWLQFGGHCDGDENVLRVAQRETYEESGIEGLILASPRPFDLDIHPIPEKDNEPAHWHYDVRYVLIAPEGAVYRTSSESLALKWFHWEDLAALSLDTGLRRLLDKWQGLLARRLMHGAPGSD
jgi:8-oxo-dGTP pyrophosphatase MutT (NUDIX family)